MAGQGPRRKPMVIKKAEGNRRKVAKSELIDDIDPGGTPEMPDFDDPVATEFWRRHVPVLMRAGLASAADEAKLITMCEWWARYRRLDETGGLRNLNELCKCFDRWSKLAGQFGMSPVDRAGLHPKAPKSDPKVVKFFGA